MSTSNYAIGRTRWAIAEGYIPEDTEDSNLHSHETACILNASDEDAHIEMYVYFGDREPAGPYAFTVPARRTNHIQFNHLSDPEPIPRETDYAAVITSDAPIVVQHTRIDARSPANALLSTVAHAG